MWSGEKEPRKELSPRVLSQTAKPGSHAFSDRDEGASRKKRNKDGTRELEHGTWNKKTRARGEELIQSINMMSSNIANCTLSFTQHCLLISPLLPYIITVRSEEIWMLLRCILCDRVWDGRERNFDIGNIRNDEHINLLLLSPERQASPKKRGIFFSFGEGNIEILIDILLQFSTTTLFETGAGLDFGHPGKDQSFIQPSFLGILWLF